jgi:MFS family permease
MPVLIGMRCLQAIGSSAVISVGAGSLADMYEVHERGQKVGLHSFSCFLPLLPWSFHSSYFSFLPLVSKDKTANITSSACFTVCPYLVPLWVH